uniref:Gypsy retrotransposon integrase-like protein 1 n=1 Tax=Varanus komodoensis TaxID=61221 RepID=A0A8D2J8T8_VARKO
MTTSSGTDSFIRAKLGEQEMGTLSSVFHFENGLLLYNHAVCGILPLREHVLQQCYDSPSAGHFSVYKTLHAVTRDFWWPCINSDVKSYVLSCHTCQLAKRQPGRPAGLLQPLVTPPGPWHTVSLDFITDLPPSKGFTTILVVMGLFTKMAHSIPFTGLPSSKTTASLFVAHIYKQHGWPLALISDRRAQFTSWFWRELLALLKVDLRLFSVHHPQTNGQMERLNATLEQYLGCYINYEHDDWSSFLPLAEFAYNYSMHA